MPTRLPVDWPAQLADLFAVVVKRAGHGATPHGRRDVPFAADPLFCDGVDVAVVLDPAAPGIADVGEQVGPQRVSAQPPALVVAVLAHCLRTDRDLVDV